MKSKDIIRLKCNVNFCRTDAYRRCHGYLHVVQPNKTNDMAMNSAFQGYRHGEIHFIRDMKCMKRHEAEMDFVQRSPIPSKICMHCALIIPL
jgi:hypothetical protein